jgi:hypothetical protein
MTQLSRADLGFLAALAEAGGSGKWDPRRGTVLVGPTRNPLKGDPHAWMVLVAAGMVAGERGKIILTDLGRVEAAKVGSGRVREGAN